MKAERTTATLGLLLALASGQALAATGMRPLQLDLTAPAPRAAATRPARLPQALDAPRPVPALASAFRRGQRAELGTRAQALREQALQSVLDPASPSSTLDEERSDGRMQLKFRKGGGLSDINKGYREMCDRVSAKIWDDPNGKRVRFDVAGKPGIGVEIPIGRHR